MTRPPWLDTETITLQAAFSADRMPHGLLIHEAPGAGGDWLATWVAQLVLCADRTLLSDGQKSPSPCGHCVSCLRVAAGQHPDVASVRPIDESRQIRIEQVRELAEGLSLTSHQGGFKVGILSPADVLNRFAANALLKTLEEPPARTVLILVATQPSRLPATILSRCQRVRIAAPSRAQALSWLEATRGRADWNAVLDIVGDAPLIAAESDAAAIVQISSDVRRGLDESVAGTLDPVSTAERWSKSELALRLRCFENWLTERIRQHFAQPRFLTEVGAVTHLQRPDTVLNIRLLFELLDGVRDLKSALESPINRGLALEGLLRRLASRGRDRNEALSLAR
jgi:DNA polymerase III subunit delta'